MTIIRLLVVCCILLTTSLSNGMIYINRFFPWYKSPFARTEFRQSRIYGAPFFVMGKENASDGLRPDGRLFEYWGQYDQNAVRQAIINAGGPDFFNTSLESFKGQEILWRMNGKLFGQGVQVFYDQHFGHYVSAGLSCFFMHLFARSSFALSKFNDSPEVFDQEAALDIARRAMDSYLGIEQPVWEKTGFSDIECYLRLGNVWDYSLKCRRIDAGLRVGAIIPSGVRRDINNPASLPFGGDGLWGVYVAGDLHVELKEDLFGGFLAQYVQQFSTTRSMRIPIANEQPLYGAVVGPMKIEPDMSFILSPYVILEGIRDGLGVRAQYTAVFHLQDNFVDERPAKIPSATLQKLIHKTDWAAEYVTIDAFYDFGKVRQDDGNTLLASLMVDIPINWLVGEHATKTTRVSFGVQYLY